MITLMRYDPFREALSLRNAALRAGQFAPIAAGTDAGVPSAYANSAAKSLESNTLT